MYKLRFRNIQDAYFNGVGFIYFSIAQFYYARANASHNNAERSEDFILQMNSLRDLSSGTYTTGRSRGYVRGRLQTSEVIEERDPTTGNLYRLAVKAVAPYKAGLSTKTMRTVFDGTVPSGMSSGVQTPGHLHVMTEAGPVKIDPKMYPLMRLHPLYNRNEAEEIVSPKAEAAATTTPAAAITEEVQGLVDGQEVLLVGDFVVPATNQSSESSIDNFPSYGSYREENNWAQSTTNAWDAGNSGSSWDVFSPATGVQEDENTRSGSVKASESSNNARSIQSLENDTESDVRAWATAEPLGSEDVLKVKAPFHLSRLMPLKEGEGVKDFIDAVETWKNEERWKSVKYGAVAAVVFLSRFIKIARK